MTTRPQGSLFQRIKAKTIGLNIPFCAHLELTDRCNLRCRHCYVTPGHGDGELTLAEWKGCLDQLAELGTLYLVLSGGEILVRPDFFEIAEYARQREFQINLFTNATLIDETVARRIRALHPHRVETSLYGASADTHDGITGVAGSFARLIRGVRLLREQGVAVQMKVTWMAPNIREAEAMRKLAAELGAALRTASMLLRRRDGDQSNEVLKVSEADLRNMYLEMFKKGREKGAPTPPEPQPVAEETARRIVPCGIGTVTCNIDAGGGVHPCPAAHAIDLGSIRDRPLAEIWQHSPVLQEIRKIRLWDLEECRGCKLWHYCNRCAAVALQERGSLTAGSAQACAAARAKYGLFQGKECELD